MAFCQFGGGAEQMRKRFMPARIKMLAGAELIHQTALAQYYHPVAEAKNRTHIVRYIK